jgi:hypothetical protein
VRIFSAPVENGIRFCVSGHPQLAREGRVKTGQRDGRVRESYAGDFPPAESTVANQISMSQKQSMAALQEQGVSNRQIAKLLRSDRDTVNRQVRLLKPQNQPGAPPGDDAGIFRAGRHPAAVRQGVALLDQVTPLLDGISFGMRSAAATPRRENRLPSHEELAPSLRRSSPAVAAAVRPARPRGSGRRPLPRSV